MVLVSVTRAPATTERRQGRHIDLKLHTMMNKQNIQNVNLRATESHTRATRTPNAKSQPKGTNSKATQKTTPHVTISYGRKCTPKRHIGFLKIHKSGSTTISNILQRYAMKHNLNLVLPNKPGGAYGFNYLGHDRNFTMKSVIPLPPKERYHILCNHVVYNRTMFRKILPGDTFYFAIVREPEERFISAAFYYSVVKKIKKQIPAANKTFYIFSEWLKNPWKYGVSVELYNHVAYDFGIGMKQFKNDTYVKQYIKMIDKDFDLVLLMNYFDESLVLLRRRLCWTIKDIVYVKQNKGRMKDKYYALSEDDRKRLRKWQSVDVAIFEHFQNKFWRQIEAEGHDLFSETVFFKNVLRRVDDFCKFGTDAWSSIVIEQSRWSESFSVEKGECPIMVLNELKMVQKLQENAWKKYNSSRH